MASNNDTMDENVSDSTSGVPTGIENQNSTTLTSGYEVHLQETEAFSGPLPSPRILKGYAELIPDAPERILRMAEEQHQHQMDIDKANVRLAEKEIDEGYRAGKRGQVFAFVNGLILIACGVYAMILGHISVALMIFGTSLAAVVMAFLRIMFRKRK